VIVEPCRLVSVGEKRFEKTNYEKTIKRPLERRVPTGSEGALEVIEKVRVRLSIRAPRLEMLLFEFWVGGR
jgi:hypothetical protein